MSEAGGRAKKPKLVRIPEKVVCCCCKECGHFFGHILFYNGYLDGKCKRCNAFEIFISDENGELTVITEEVPA